MQKKENKWVRPVLTVLVRDEPGERVCLTCKITGYVGQGGVYGDFEMCEHTGQGHCHKCESIRAT